MMDRDDYSELVMVPLRPAEVRGVRLDDIEGGVKSGDEVRIDEEVSGRIRVYVNGQERALKPK
jgi:hypothetical protein